MTAVDVQSTNEETKEHTAGKAKLGAVCADELKQVAKDFEGAQRLVNELSATSLVDFGRLWPLIVELAVEMIPAFMEQDGDVPEPLLAICAAAVVAMHRLEQPALEPLSKAVQWSLLFVGNVADFDWHELRGMEALLPSFILRGENLDAILELVNRAIPAEYERQMWLSHMRTFALGMSAFLGEHFLALHFDASDDKYSFVEADTADSVFVPRSVHAAFVKAFRDLSDSKFADEHFAAVDELSELLDELRPLLPARVLEAMQLGCWHQELPAIVSGYVLKADDLPQEKRVELDWSVSKALCRVYDSYVMLVFGQLGMVLAHGGYAMGEQAKQDAPVLGGLCLEAGLRSAIAWGDQCERSVLYTVATSKSADANVDDLMAKMMLVVERRDDKAVGELVEYMQSCKLPTNHVASSLQGYLMRSARNEDIEEVAMSVMRSVGAGGCCGAGEDAGCCGETGADSGCCRGDETMGGCCGGPKQGGCCREPESGSEDQEEEYEDGDEYDDGEDLAMQSELLRRLQALRMGKSLEKDDEEDEDDFESYDDDESSDQLPERFKRLDYEPSDAEYDELYASGGPAPYDSIKCDCSSAGEEGHACDIYENHPALKSVLQSLRAHA